MVDDIDDLRDLEAISDVVAGTIPSDEDRLWRLTHLFPPVDSEVRARLVGATCSIQLNSNFDARPS